MTAAGERIGSDRSARLIGLLAPLATLMFFQMRFMIFGRIMVDADQRSWLVESEDAKILINTDH